MSTFLELCQDGARECRIKGEGPTTVVDQTGQLGDIVRWIRNYYIELQCEQSGRWRFLRATFTLDTVADQRSYAPSAGIDVSFTVPTAITRFGRWRLADRWDYPKIYLVSSGVGSETWLTWLPWESFKNIYLIGTEIKGQPAHITVDPQENIVLGPTPNGIYRVTGDYYRSPQDLLLGVDPDTNVPEMPQQHHQVLVYFGAMDKWAGAQSAEEVKVRVAAEGMPLRRNLRNHQGDKFRLGKPLA